MTTPNLSVPEPAPAHDPEAACVADQVMSDFADRKQFGIDKYGDCLKDDDGRNPAVDMYQELLDGAVYGRKLVNYVAALHAKIADLEGRLAWYDSQPMPLVFDPNRRLKKKDIEDMQAILDPHKPAIIASATPARKPKMQGARPVGVIVDEVPTLGEKVAAEMLVLDAVTPSRPTRGMDGWPKAYADFPWREVEEQTNCAFCGEEQFEGTAMRTDPEGMTCMNCIIMSRRERRDGSRGL